MAREGPGVGQALIFFWKGKLLRRARTLDRQCWSWIKCAGSTNKLPCKGNGAPVQLQYLKRDMATSFPYKGAHSLQPGLKPAIVGHCKVVLSSTIPMHGWMLWSDPCILTPSILTVQRTPLICPCCERRTIAQKAGCSESGSHECLSHTLAGIHHGTHL